MAWQVENPPSMMVEMAYDLYNTTKSSDLPDPVGAWGIDDSVWAALIELTRTRCRALHIPVTSGDQLKGMCIWASVVAAKFYVHKFAYIDSRVIRVRSTSDHYFVSIRGQGISGICDITCNQFGGPNYIRGALKDTKGPAQKVKIAGSSLYDAYVLGANSSLFVI